MEVAGGGGLRSVSGTLEGWSGVCNVCKCIPDAVDVSADRSVVCGAGWRQRGLMGWFGDRGVRRWSQVVLVAGGSRAVRRASIDVDFGL